MAVLRKQMARYVGKRKKKETVTVTPTEGSYDDSGEWIKSGTPFQVEAVVMPIGEERIQRTDGEFSQKSELGRGENRMYVLPRDQDGVINDGDLVERSDGSIYEIEETDTDTFDVDIYNLVENEPGH